MLYIFILGRILLGTYFMMMGMMHFKNLGMLSGFAASKGVPMPRGAVMLTGAMMFLGGLGVLLGIWMDLAVLLLAVFLIVTTFTMHQYWNIADPNAKMTDMINFHKNLGLLGAVLMLLAIPAPWVWSLTSNLFW